MPDWKVHLVFGFLFLSLFLSLNCIFRFLVLDLQKIFIFTLLVPFVSIFPDVDTKKSKSRKVISLFLSSTIFLIYLLVFPGTWYYGIGYFILLYFLIKLLPTRHRGMTHSFYFSFIFSIPASYFLSLALSLNFYEFSYFFIIIFSVYALHLLLDKF